MPVYNREKYVAEAIQSIQKQTFTDFEFIIVDDGSTDKSLDIIKSYREADSRIKLITGDNQGAAKARNRGISACQTDFIAFMDDDDISTPDRLEKLYQFLIDNPDVSSVNSQRAPIRKDNVPKDYTASPVRHRLFKDSIQEKGTDLLSFLEGRGRNFAVGSNSMVRKSAIDSIGGFREIFSCNEDTDITLRFEEQYNMGAIPLPLYLQRSHETPGRVSTTSNSWRYLAAAFISAHFRRTTGDDPLENMQTIDDALPLFSQLPQSIKVHLIRKLIQSWKRQIYKSIKNNSIENIESVSLDIRTSVSQNSLGFNRKQAASIRNTILKSAARCLLALRLKMFIILASTWLFTMRLKAI